MTIDPQDPGSVAGEFEDIAEISMTTEDDRFLLVCWGGQETHDLSPLPAGAATYRLRYHARGMDKASGGARRDIDGPPLDEYLLQVWPAPYQPPAFAQLASRSAQAMQNMWRR
ncbi:hypothetical protein ACFY36_32020 [Actinoplanes sp. NPDC000266]